MGHTDQIQICPMVKGWQNGRVYDELLRQFMKKIVMIITLLIISMLPLALYFIKFGLNSDLSLNLTLANELNNWAAFGSYIGGTLGPLFSALAFIGIWLTYKIQREQISLFKSQAKADEIQRIISVTSDRIDMILKSGATTVMTTDELGFEYEPDDLAELDKIKATPFIDMLLHLATTNIKAKGLPPKSEDIIWKNHVVKRKAVFTSNIIAFNVEANQLGWLFDEFNAAGGEQKVIEFYINRFQAAITWLNALECLRAPLLKKYFDTHQIEINTGEIYFDTYIAPKC